MSRAAIFSAGAVGVALGSADCGPVGINHYGAPFFVDEDGSSVSDDGSSPASDGSETTDASGAVDAPAMAMPHYGGFMPVDGGGGSRD